MKKAISAVLVIILALSVFAVTASANGKLEKISPELNVLNEASYLDIISEPYSSPSSDKGVYYGKFTEWILLSEYNPEVMPEKYGTFSDYEELYYHTPEQGTDPDWALIGAHVEMFNLTTEIQCRRFGSRALVSWRSGAGELPFELVIYDADSDSFTGIRGKTPFGLSENNLDKYEGLTEAIESLGLGYQIGDTDMNGEIDIVDVTVGQRLLIGLISDWLRDYREARSVLADLNGDGFDITDVTRLQRFLVHLGELYS